MGRQDNIGTWGFVCIMLTLFGGITYGIWHDFSPEYEASVPIQYEMIVMDANGNEIVVGEAHSNRNKNFVIQGNKVISLTPLNEEELKIQEEKGCIPCHPK